MEAWYFLEHKPCEPAWNMACDEWLLKHISRLGQPVLRTYGWSRPGITIGYFQPFPASAPPHAVIVRRLTGGAMVVHDSDLTFTVVLPSHHPWWKLRVHERYQQLHQRIHKVFELRGLTPTLARSGKTSPSGRAGKNDLCFSKNSRYDVLIQGIKVAGGAQRWMRHGLLHQGSIQDGGQQRVSPNELRHAWEMGGASFTNLKLSSDETTSISTLAAGKYASPNWNHRLKS